MKGILSNGLDEYKRINITKVSKGFPMFIPTLLKMNS